MIAGVATASPATLVASARIEESPETSVGSTTPVDAASLISEIRDEMAGWIEV